MARLATFLCALAALVSAEDDPVDVLFRLREQVTAHAQRIPNHICVETIQRDRFQPVGSVPKACDDLLARRKKSGAGAFLKAGIMDRLRLDVALADGHEIYSWAGAGKFEDGGIDEIIHEGPIGTGPFGAMLLAIFDPRNPRFFYDGDTTLAGQDLLQFSFTVAREVSEYKVKTNGGDWYITGYTGTLLVEPHTATLVRLTIRTDELPPETTACETDTTLDYATVNLNGLGYLLPAASRQRFISRDGAEAENTINFTGCREYRAESVVSFGDQPSASEAAHPTASPPSIALPENLSVAVDLTANVALDQAAAGDAIAGRLALPILDTQGKKGKTLVPEGTALSGRLMRVETRYSTPREISVAIRWETIELNGVKTPISLGPARSESVRHALAPRGTLQRRPTRIDLPLPGEGRFAIFHFKGDHPFLKSGLRSDWVTVKP